MTYPLSKLVHDIHQCTLCAAHLPLPPKPIFQFHSSARILIAGQAPGRITHHKGRPFDDPSGKRLRSWMGISDDLFYTPELVAILPMGMCYPGTLAGGDLPPRPECAPKWRAALLSHLPNLELVLVIGKYAHSFHISEKPSSVTALVHNWRTYAPSMFPLPHPSPRNISWLRKNPWFEAETIPALQAQVNAIVQI